MSNPLRDMELPEVMFCIGTNMTECHPVAATRLKKAKAKGARLIVADPRRIRLAEHADLYLPLRVGSDVALLLAMAHVLVRDGLVDEEFIQTRTRDFEAFRDHVGAFTPEWAEAICEVPAVDIELAARWYGEARPGAIYYTLGITEHISGVDNVQSLSNLALMTGNLGKVGGGINPMRGQNNIQGAGDCGAIPSGFPGFQACDDPANVAKFGKAYGREIDCEKGITKVTALDRAGDSIHAMLIDGENTVVSDPDKGHCEKALRSLEHLVLIDIFETETSKFADVVLPATSWAETDGVVTNTERRPQRLRAAVPAPGEARPDWWILSELAKRMDMKGFEYSGPAEVFDELCSLSPIYAGLDWNLVGTGAYQWPVPEKGHPGTPRLHEKEFPNGRGIFKVIRYRDPSEVVDEEFPIWLTTGRRLETYHTNTQTGRSLGIDYFVPHEVLEVHPEDLVRLGIGDGEVALLESRRGGIEIRVHATSRSPRGTVFSSFSFVDTPINDLTGGGYDPVTQTAELKVCPVRLTALRDANPMPVE